MRSSDLRQMKHYILRSESRGHTRLPLLRRRYNGLLALRRRRGPPPRALHGGGGVNGYNFTDDDDSVNKAETLRELTTHLSENDPDPENKNRFSKDPSRCEFPKSIPFIQIACPRNTTDWQCDTDTRDTRNKGIWNIEHLSTKNKFQIKMTVPLKEKQNKFFFKVNTDTSEDDLAGLIRVLDAKIVNESEQVYETSSLVVSAPPGMDNIIIFNDTDDTEEGTTEDSSCKYIGKGKWTITLHNRKEYSIEQQMPSELSLFDHSPEKIAHNLLHSYEPIDPDPICSDTESGD